MFNECSAGIALESNSPKSKVSGAFSSYGYYRGQQDMAEPVGAELFQVIEGKIQFYRAVKVKQLSNDLLLAHRGDLGTHLFKRKISGHLYLPF